jgi:hypothetical protein
MKRKVSLSAVVVGPFVLLQSCTYDKELLIPLSNCPDTVNVSYASTVKHCLRTNCFTCNGNGSNLENVSLETYDNQKSLASNGRLPGSISHRAGFAAMPLGADKLSECDIETIKAWIEDGSRNK